MINLDTQYEALMRGEYSAAKEMSYKLLEKEPWCNRTAFNAGWFKLSEGKVQEGYKLLDRGREETIWGDPSMGSSQPIWRGHPGSTVILRLERGLGDQFHQVRYARDLKARGCTVIVSCSSTLSGVLRHAEGVDVIVQHEAAQGVLHDHYLPAMSAPIALNLEQDDLRGDQYISRPPVDSVPGRIGLCWQGNPAYEHATKRKFPPELLFNVMKGRGDCVSLQRDEGSELCPDWVEKVNLNAWTDTAMAMASCSLIVTSCTSIAHLSGAMGIPTIILVPLVPYYLWSSPGPETVTPYYSTTTLLRQTNTDDWLEPFQQLAGILQVRRAA
jgi:hypothetical protein